LTGTESLSLRLACTVAIVPRLLAIWRGRQEEKDFSKTKEEDEDGKNKVEMTVPILPEHKT
jgi:hypothetical protein